MQTVTTIGLDIAKSVFQIHGIDAAGNVIVRRKLKGHRSIYGGRMSVRNVLYMAALSASRYSPALKAFHKRLADADKKSKVIIVAVMRKMITTLNAMLRDNAAWQPQST